MGGFGATGRATGGGVQLVPAGGGGGRSRAGGTSSHFCGGATVPVCAIAIAGISAAEAASER